MPEGDTVWLTAHRLDLALAGREVTRFDLRVPRLALADLRGATVHEVRAHGKHILMRFDDGRTLHSHLRMDGSWRLDRASRAEPSAAGAQARAARTSGGSRRRSDPRRAEQFAVRAVVGNADWLASGHRVHDLDLAATAEEGRWVGHLGPDVLGADWDVDRVTANLRADGARPVVEALLDQRNLAGVGNMYAAELLFLAGANPLRPVADVDDLARLAPIAYRLLRANRDHPEQSTTGAVGRGQEHWVYARVGQPCRRCGTAIVSRGFAAPTQPRLTYWCPRCQPGRD